MKLTHRQIEVFRAVMLTGQVTRAAEALHTSQPTVSRELARLEHVLGLQLFERAQGRLRATARAQALMEAVERSYLGLDRIAQLAESLRDFEQGRLAVACLPALAQALLPEAVKRFLAAHPKAGVTITPQDSPGLETWLTEQRFDLGLTERRDAPPGTAAQLLLEADEVVVLPEGHPLLAKRVIQAKDLAGQAFVSLGAADPYRQQLDAVLAAQGIERVLALETGSAASVCSLVRQGLGMGVINPLTALAWSGAGLAWRPLAVRIPFRVSVVWPLHRSAHPLQQAMVQALSETAQTLMRQLGQRPGQGRGRARSP